MPTVFDALTLRDAQKYVADRAPDEGQQEALDFYAGEHWRDGAGWIGQRPPDTDQGKMLAALRAGFVSTNASAEVVNRHRDAALGREPRWSFVPRRPLADDEELSEGERALADEAGAALTTWWDRRRVLDAAQRAVARMLATGTATLRFRIPIGLRDAAGRLAAPDLAAALDLIRVAVADPGAAGVFADPDTEAEIGVVVAGRDGKPFAEVCYLDEAGNTIWRTIREDGGGEAGDPLPLGGNLLLYDLARDPLLTPQIRQLQKALNLNLTQMMRNINLAGSLERIVLNAQRPGHWADAAGNRLTPQQALLDADARFVETPLPVGAGVSAFLAGLEQVNDQTGQTTYANPSVQWRDPVPVGTFTDTQAALHSLILHGTGQAHAAISGDATASGVSRQQARAEFEATLRMTKTILDAAIRWILETALALAAAICNRAGAFAELRAEVACQVEAGPLLAEERRQIVAEYEAGIFSWETTAGKLGAEDPDAERARIQAEREEADAAFGVVAGRQGQQGTTAGAATGPPPADVLAGELGEAG